MKRSTIIVIAIIVVLAAAVAMSYNGLVSKQEAVDTAWSQVQTVYQRRLDLIPNLVATVKGYATHEKSTLVEVTKARQSVMQLPQTTGNLTKQNFQAFQQAQSGLTSALGRLMVVVERYPDLKASQNFLTLQSQLEGTENRISVERHRFNNTAKTYNIQIRQFPSVIIARIFEFNEKPYYQAEAQAAQAPKVSF